MLVHRPARPAPRARAQRAIALVTAALASAVSLGQTGCTPPVLEPPPLNVLGTGTFTGEVYADGAPISGAVVEVIGTAARATSQAPRQFALYPVPVGKHTIAVHDATGRAARFEAEIPTENVTITLPEEQTTLGAPATVTGAVAPAGGASPLGAVVFVVGGTSTEVAFVTADDGSFTLTNVPSGARQVAVSLGGFDVARVDVEAVAGETVAVAAPIALAPLADAAATLRLSGVVKVAGLADHAGTLINVDDARLYEAEHAFMRDVGPRYEPEATDRVFEAMVALFRRAR
jgi:hypothetical protein